MKKRFISLATRNALVYFFLFATGLVVSTILFFSYSSTEILDLTKKRVKHADDMVQLKFETYIDQLETDLNQLSYSPLFVNYLNETDSVFLRLLTQEYESFLGAKQDYFQIRLIAADADGKEIIRVESLGDSIVTCPQEDLQFKGDRDYFKEILTMPYDSLYLSKIDLNKEYGEITSPRVPTLRIGKKIRGERLNDIMLVVNVDLTGVFDEFLELLPKEYELRVLNQDGDYFIHPDAEAVFTFEYDRDPFYQSEYNLAIEEITNEGNTELNEDAVDHFFQLKYPRNGYELYGVISAKKEVIFASFYNWRNKVLVASVGIAVAFLFMAFIYMRRQSKDLSNITKRLTLFSSKMEPSKIEVNRKDEIGELAKSFENMSAEIYQSHSEVAKAKDAAEKAFKEKNEFLENMSHEIRNPLQAILGVTAILEQNVTGQQQKPFIDSLKFSAIQLNSLVTDVLDYSKIKKGQIELVVEWNELERFCLDLINANRYLANKKNIALNFKYDDALKLYLFKFDQVRFYQIFNNLLNNAIKFTPSGGCVDLSVRFNNGKVHVSIKDSGDGIPQEDLQKILDRSVGTDYTTGSGLGLTIVQELLDLHGAALKVNSELNVGTEFDFEVELDFKDKNDKSEIPISNATAIQSILNILILEDDPTLIDWYRHILSAHVLKIKSDFSSLESSEKGGYDLVISDLNFGNKSHTVASIIHKIEPYLEVNGSLLIVSGNDDVDAGNGVTILQKPVRKEVILEAVQRFQLIKKHGKLNFSNLENDYDNDATLVNNALNVLIKEWERDSNTLKVAVLNRDQEKFDAVKHRIITSVRRLEINSFEAFLNTIDLTQPQKYLDDTAKLIQEKLACYIQEMKAY